MGKDLPAGLDNFAGLVQVSEHDVGFDLRVGVGVLGVVSRAPHPWHRAQECAHGSGELSDRSLLDDDMAAGTRGS